MTLLALIRHMPSAWNRDGRLQPADVATAPAVRAGRVTFHGEPPAARPDDRGSPRHHRAIGFAPRRNVLGQVEGRTLRELRLSFAATIEKLETRGLDFRAPNGESRREVQARRAPLLAEIVAAARPTAAITHKGVIRAVFALATGWDMLGRPPHKLSWSTAQIFRLDGPGRPCTDRLNLSLAR